MKNQTTYKLQARQVIIPVLIFLVIQLTVTLVIAFLCGEGWLPEDEMSNIATSLAAVMGFAAMLICDRRMGIGALTRDSVVRSGLAPLMVLSLLLAVSLNVSLNGLILMSGIQKIDPLYQSASATFAEGSAVFRFLAYGILVPVAEEALFRGVVYQFFKSRFSGSGRRHAAAIALTSLVFAVYHGNFTQGIYTFLLSLVMCLMVDCGGLIPAVILHMGINLVSLAGEYSGTYVRMMSDPLTYWPLILISLVVSILLVGLSVRISKPR